MGQMTVHPERKLSDREGERVQEKNSWHVEYSVNVNKFFSLIFPQLIFVCCRSYRNDTIRDIVKVNTTYLMHP